MFAAVAMKCDPNWGRDDEAVDTPIPTSDDGRHKQDRGKMESSRRGGGSLKELNVGPSSANVPRWHFTFTLMLEIGLLTTYTYSRLFEQHRRREDTS